jgi:hypothetical protein
MPVDKKEQKELWVKFAHDAQSRYVIPDEIEDVDQLVDDMIEASTQYADGMLDEYEKRFASSTRRSSRHRRRAGTDPDPEAEEEEEEEEEETE